MTGFTLCDYHMHTPLCGDAEGEYHEYAQYAEKRGLSEIGFTGHCPQYYLPPAERDGHCSIVQEELGTYIEEVSKVARNKQGTLEVRTALEVDYVPGKEKGLVPFLHYYDWDYLLLSVHFINGWAFDDPRQVKVFDEKDVDKVYTEYYRILMQGMRTGYFHVVAHFDLPKKFGHRPGRNVREEEDALHLCRDMGLVLEVNTAGLRKPVKEVYPSLRLLKKAFNLGIEVCLGSDAHRPEEVAAGFCSALKALKEAGYTHLVCFRNGEKHQYPIPEGYCK